MITQAGLWTCPGSTRRSARARRFLSPCGWALIYMDLCCFNRPFDDQSQKRILLETEAKLLIQEMVQSGEIRLVWSYMLEYENAANPDLEVMTSIAEWKRKASGPCRSENENIVREARKLRHLGLGSRIPFISRAPLTPEPTSSLPRTTAFSGSVI